MDLDESIHTQVVALSESGQRRLARGDTNGAVDDFRSAIELLPPPWDQWEAATWLYAAIGDAYWEDEQYEAARNAFLDGLNCSGALDNPFYYLRLGETHLELGLDDQAFEYFSRAYLLDGNEIFDGEPRKYRRFFDSRWDGARRG